MLTLRTLSNFTVNSHVRSITAGSRELSRDTIDINTFSIDSFRLLETDFTAQSLSVVVNGEIGSTDRHHVGDVIVRYGAKAGFGESPNYPAQVSSQLANSAALTLYANNQPQQFSVYHPRSGRVWRGTVTDSISFSTSALLLGDKLFVSLSAAAKTPKLSVFRPISVDLGATYAVIGSHRQDAWPMGADEYAAFRRSPRHGSYRTAAYQVEDLYDQFNYGLRDDGRAVRNFVSKSSRRGALKMLMLLGKGREFSSVRTAAQRAVVQNQSYFLPTYGFPSSDNLMVADGLTGQMQIAIGRYAVESPAELDIIHRKVVAVDELLADNPPLRGLEWTKDVLHLGGGNSASEQANIQRSLRAMTSILLDSDLAPDVSAVYKQANVPIQSSDLDNIFDRINKGLNTVIFFGHGSTTTFEINIERPERYSNLGKYPMLLAYGCYSGNCNSLEQTIGEDFLGYQDKGFVAFGASSGLNFPNSITVFGSDFYRAFADTHYDEPVGEAMKVAINKSLAYPSNDYLQRQHGEQFIFQADPALMMYKHRGPDVYADGASFRIGNGVLSPEQTSYEVSINLVNLGRSATDSFQLVVERESSARPRQVIDTLWVKDVGTSKTISFDMPSWGRDGVGFNRLWFRIVGLEAQAAVAGAFDNDQTGPLGFAVADSRIQILYPTKLEVVQPANLTLYAEAGNFWDAAKRYEWQVSASSDYPASSTISSTVESQSLIRFQPSTPLTVGQLYHARVRAVGDTTWSSTMFRTSDTVAVANLSSYQEFKLGQGSLIEPTPGGSWRFASTGLNKTLTLNAFGLATPPSFVTSFENPAVSIRPWSYSDTSVTIMVADSLTGQEFPWNGAFGSLTAGNPNRTLTFNVATPAARAKVARLLDSIPQRGNFVWFWTNFRVGSNFQPDSWVNDSLITGGRSLLGVLRENGARRIDDWIAGGTAPYAILFHQDIEVFAEVLGANANSTVVINYDLPRRSFEGTYTSPILSKLRTVKSVSWTFDDTGRSAKDQLFASLRGITPVGDTVLLTSSNQVEVDFQLSPADTARFDKFFLQAYLGDETDRSPMSLLRFAVFGSLRPEIAFDPSISAVLPQDTIAPKGELRFSIGLRNVSPSPILTPTTLGLEQLPTNLPLSTKTLGPLAGWANATWSDTLQLPSSGTIELAWRLQSETADTRAVANDIGYFTTRQGLDKTVPDLTVLVEGEPLRNRQLLAPSPVFQVEVRDDIAMDSMRSTSLEIELTTPSGEQITSTNLPGSLEIVQSPGNSARRRTWEFRPGTLPDGVYGLRLVAIDDAGNRTRNGSLNYEFEIDNTVAISNVLPYPNPMVDAVRFQYELTGEVPSDYQIAIYSSSGRLVRSLGPDDLGPLQIGRRLTQGTWNGTDEYGQRLARGVYLYRFQVEQATQGVDFEHRSTGAEKAVESGFGKLVIVR